MDVEALRKQYLPSKIKVLFIAEAKPDADDRFFYYDNVRTHDHLYLYMMYALYGETKGNEKHLRENKAEFLNRFKRDGYYLLDAVDEIKADTKTPTREKAIKANAVNKIAEIRELLSVHGDQDTRIVLIKAPVFDVLYDLMKDEFNIVNDFKVYFPSTGRERDFLEQMKTVIKRLHA